MKIPIVCNGNRGFYLVHSSTCICCCVACNERAKRADLPCIQISPTEFERHSGKPTKPLTDLMNITVSASRHDSMRVMIPEGMCAFLEDPRLCCLPQASVGKCSERVSVWVACPCKH